MRATQYRLLKLAVGMVLAIGAGRLGHREAGTLQAGTGECHRKGAPCADPALWDQGCVRNAQAMAALAERSHGIAAELLPQFECLSQMPDGAEDRSGADPRAASLEPTAGLTRDRQSTILIVFSLLMLGVGTGFFFRTPPRSRMATAIAAAPDGRPGEMGGCPADGVDRSALNAVHRGSPLAPMDREKRARLRILLVEDNFVNLEVGLGILAHLGYTADVAYHGSEAIQALSEKDYDLVLMARHLPDMDGDAVTRLIRQPDSAVRNHAIPVICLTAYAMEEDREKCLAEGMNSSVATPIETAVLEDAIERWTTEANAGPVLEVAAHPKPAAAAAFDGEGLLDRLMGNEDLARRVVRQFVDDAPRQLELLAQAVADADAVSVTQVAHAIKGAAANTGGKHLRELAGKMEQMGRSGDLAGAAATLPELAAGLDAALPVMERFSKLG